jgi:DNA-binding IclR family transcriptional regulator
MSDPKNEDTTDGKGEDRYTVPALARGLQLLMSFNRDERELTGAELSRRLDLPRASVFRMLQTLEQGGFVERVGDGASYKLGLSVLRLGFEYLASMELTEHGRPVIEDLRDLCGYSAHVVVRDNRDVVFVAKAAGRSAMFHSIQVGARLPAHATVLGRLLLSDLDINSLRHLYPEEPLPAYTARTPTTLAQLKGLIDEDRARGYAVSQGGFETGISTIAAPVFNDRNEVVACVSITVPAQRVQEGELDVLINQVRDAAAQLTERISHTPHRGQWLNKPNDKKAA